MSGLLKGSPLIRGPTRLPLRGRESSRAPEKELDRPAVGVAALEEGVAHSLPISTHSNRGCSRIAPPTARRDGIASRIAPANAAPMRFLSRTAAIKTLTSRDSQ